jgi:hypothetical protein
MRDFYDAVLRRKSPCDARRHDCGRFGELTVRDICQVSGQRESTIYARIRKGWSGELLVARKQPSHAPGRPRSATMVTALQLGIETARRGRLLTVREIQTLHPMARQPAERWRCALRVAMRKTDDGPNV